MTQYRMDEIEAAPDAVVQVSTLEEDDSDDRGFVNLRIIHPDSTLDVLLDPDRALDLAEALKKHAARA